MSAAGRINAVIRFEPDGYDVQRRWLMGRQVAGHGFLRAAVAERGPGALYAHTASPASADAFTRIVQGFDPAVRTGWIPADRPQQIGRAGGVLYLGDANLPAFARQRLSAGIAAFSLCGVTHTTATPETMRGIAELLSAPVAPWDALVCTSSAVVETVRRIHEAEAEALRWRLGRNIRIAAPRLPVIPLGVHSADFTFSPDERAAARQALGLVDDEVMALFVGRLSFTSKHHPFALYRGLEAAARRTGRRVALVQCGWAPNAAIQAAFEEGWQVFAPAVRTMLVEGRDEAVRRGAWAAADIFVSVSDGIQETFGLTPIEAMAAGLPSVVSDWNGYRDTVRDGVDGFRVPTWAPAPGAAGESIAREQQAGKTSYDGFLWAAAAATSVDPEALADRLATLIENPDLRCTMGEAARRRARETFEWTHIIGQYQALWADLAAHREAAKTGAEAAWIAAAPRAAASALDPFHAFGHYPTALIETETPVTLAPGATPAAYEALRANVLFGDLRLPDTVALALLERLAQGPADVAELAAAAGVPAEAAVYLVGLMAKMELVRLGSG